MRANGRTSRRARLAALVVVAVGLVAPPAGAQASRPGAEAIVSQFAYATNIVHKDGSDYMYLAGAERSTRSNGRTKTVAFAERSKCLTLQKKNLKLIACAAFVYPRRIPDAAFEFDPLLESASVWMKGKGGRTAMRWAGRGTPEPDAGPYADAGYGAGAYADLYRSARASGRILDERYPKGGFGFALMDEGVGAEGYTSRNVTVTRMDNGALKIEARYRIPR